MILYRITNSSNGKAYIGMTRETLRCRWTRHINAARRKTRDCKALHRAMKKYGAENFAIEQIGRAADWASLKEMERAAIAVYATFRPSGYNLTLGGEGTVGWTHTAATRAKLSAIHKGKTIPQWQRDATAEKNRGRVVSAEQRERSAAKQRGRAFSAEHKANLKVAMEKLWASPEFQRSHSAGQKARWQRARAVRNQMVA